MPSRLQSNLFVPKFLPSAARGKSPMTPPARQRNIALLLEYDGTRYAGFQLQKNALTVQEVLERAIGEIFRERIRVHPAGRTDSGAHAVGQVVNFRTSRDIPEQKILLALNSRLPDDVRVRRVWRAASGFHAQFSARGKVYTYTVLASRAARPLLRATAYHCPDRLNLSRIRRGAKLLVGRRDFRAFEGAGNRQKNAVRSLRRLEIRRRGELLEFRFEGDGFLTHMVRNIVGTLLEVGRGKRAVSDIARILRSRDRRTAGPAAPAKGLVLQEVKYGKAALKEAGATAGWNRVLRGRTFCFE